MNYFEYFSVFKYFNYLFNDISTYDFANSFRKEAIYLKLSKCIAGNFEFDKKRYRGVDKLLNNKRREIVDSPDRGFLCSH